ncbi:MULTISPECIES: hypothetical protein [Pedobacter]|jgi:hypothetical protein|uniref:Uncharacterized protein n=1 Tax=Pedobacter rhizosphaerae TaxID=390241 RepID=A0A1H9VKM2_9SPHI|nr:hypothetical protein [Pedobacter rhizosphaerae]SES22139.1 hypothetical protein SAMN04488023_14423 [Pedobacter rhizosphaerae]
MAQNNISKLLQNKLETLKIEVEQAQAELKKWSDIAAEYEAGPEKFEMLSSLFFPESEGKKARKAKG